MLRLFISTLILFNFTVNLTAESFEINEAGAQSEMELSKAKNSSIPTLDISDDCDDCKTGDCEHGDCHCTHQCSASHNLLVSRKSIFKDPIEVENCRNVNCPYTNHYKNPFLESVIIPPNFS